MLRTAEALHGLLEPNALQDEPQEAWMHTSRPVLGASDVSNQVVAIQFRWNRRRMLEASFSMPHEAVENDLKLTEGRLCFIVTWTSAGPVPTHVRIGENLYGLEVKL